MNIVRGIVRAILMEAGKRDILLDPLHSYIGDYGEAERFAEDFLKRDIPDLKYFSLDEYLPRSGELLESWSFAASTMGDQYMNITIDRKVRNETSLWKLTYSESSGSNGREPMQMIEVEDTGWVSDYAQFRSRVKDISSAWAY